MTVAILFSYAVMHLCLFAASFLWGIKGSIRLIFLQLMLFGMIYDNLVTGLGPWFIEERLYEIFNYPRYLLHSAVLPFLTIFALSTLQSAGVAVASKKIFIGFCWLFTTVAWWYGVLADAFQVELVQREVMGSVRLANGRDIIPYATILTNLWVVVMAFMLWRQIQWPWMFAGGLFILLVNGAFGSQPWGPLSGNGAEVVFIFSLLMTERHLRRREQSQRVSQ